MLGKFLGKQVTEYEFKTYSAGEDNNLYLSIKTVPGSPDVVNYQITDDTGKGVSIVEQPARYPEEARGLKKYNVVDRNYSELYDGTDPVSALQAAARHFSGEEQARLQHINNLFNSDQNKR